MRREAVVRIDVARAKSFASPASLSASARSTTRLGREINPRDAQSYFVTDGQKDIATCFDRESSRVISAPKFDWRRNNSKNLRDCWTQALDVQDLPSRILAIGSQCKALGRLDFLPQAARGFTR
jgi:hypothetical protein